MKKQPTSVTRSRGGTTPDGNPPKSAPSASKGSSTPRDNIGRPSKYTPSLADTICDKLMEGMSLRQICKEENMPHRATVLRWMANDPAFATKCAHARAEQADLMDDMILDIANACTPDTAIADRVKISAYQWRAAKLSPKKYGDKVDVTSGGAPFVAPIIQLSAPND